MELIEFRQLKSFMHPNELNVFQPVQILAQLEI